MVYNPHRDTIVTGRHHHFTPKRNGIFRRKAMSRTPERIFVRNKLYSSCP